MPALPGGGAEKVLIDILKHWDYDRCAVSLLLERYDGVYLNDIPGKVRVIAIPRWVRGIRRIGKRINMLNAVFARIVQRMVDVAELDAAVSFMEGEAVKLHSFIAAKVRRNVSWIHIDMSSKHWTSVFFENQNDELHCYDMMDHLVFVSGQAKAGFESLFKSNRTPKSVIYNLIDVAEIQRLSAEKSFDKTGLVICMAGRLNFQKRYDRALNVLKMLVDGGLAPKLWIVGDGELRGELEMQVASLGITDNVVFWGFRKPPYPYMAVADVFLNTSEAEGYPLTICEALALGLPVVATDVSGAREILGDSMYGIVSGQDDRELYLNVRRMLSDETLLESYREKALLRSSAFTVDSVMSEIFNVALLDNKMI